MSSRRPKLSVRPTLEELEKLHERAGAAGYDSLSAFLVDRGLCDVGVLPRERRTLEELVLHVRLLTAVVEAERRKRESGILNPVTHSTLDNVARRAAESLRLINLILGRAAAEGAAEEAA